jgi:hypothetical protein
MPHSNKEEIVRKYQRQLQDHPVVVFADSAITTLAIRNGTRGYTSGENLNDFLGRIIPEIIDLALSQYKKEVVEAAAKLPEATRTDVESGESIVLREDIISLIQKE